MIPNFNSLIPVYIAGRPEPLPQGFRRVVDLDSAKVVLCLFGWMFDEESKRVFAIKRDASAKRSQQKIPIVMSMWALDLIHKVHVLGKGKKKRKIVITKKHFIPNFTGRLETNAIKEMISIGIKFGPVITQAMTKPYAKMHKLHHKSIAKIMRGATHKKLREEVRKELTT